MPTLGASKRSNGSTGLRGTAANKSGPHHTVFWVKKNPKFDESKRLGLSDQHNLQYTSGHSYSGEWNGNCKHGFGVLIKGDGTKYEGYWKNDQRHGTGTIWERREKKLFKRYTGAWFKGRFHGAGVYFYDNGDKYEGQWKHNKRQGRGTMEYANGDIYEGDWDSSKRSGIGVLLYANGDRFEGSFHQDVKEGPGRHFYVSTKKMYEGEWHADTARCGIYSDLPAQFAADQPEPSSYVVKLPALALTHAEGVLDDAVQDVEGRRISGPTAITGYAQQKDESKKLTREQLAQMQDLFEESDSSGAGYLDIDELKSALRRLGLRAPVDQVNGFLQDCKITALTDVHWEQFVRVVQMMLS